MRGEAWNADRARRGEAVLEQGPIEGFAIKGNQHRPLRNTCGKSVENGMLLNEITHDELLDLNSSGVPPRDADEKCVRARAASNARGFGIQKQPSCGIGKRGLCAL